MEVKYANELFVRTSYNGFGILVRKADNYVNATKMCKDIDEKTKVRDEKSGKKHRNVEFRKLARGEKWNEAV